MKADLHVHSNYSDGYDDVETVIRLAKENGIEMLSFVDHDTTEAYAEAQKIGDQHGVRIIPGIEISAYDFRRNRKVHILGYNYRSDASHIKGLCNELLERRNDHSWIQLEKLIDNGYEIHTSKLKKSNTHFPVLYKQHIMDSLTEAAYSSEEYQSLYKKLFKGNGICAGDIEYVDANLAVRAIKADGGIAVLAHPGQLDSFDMVPELVKSGLSGIELYHPDHSELDHEKIKALAKNHQLFMTGGTDYHGKYGETVSLGAFLTPEKSLLYIG